MARYENKILVAVLAAEAAIFTSKFVLKLEENIYFVCNFSLDIFCGGGGGEAKIFDFSTFTCFSTSVTFTKKNQVDKILFHIKTLK